MTDAVNPRPDDIPTLRAAHVAQTEERLVDAATRLFSAHGYSATSLAAVAEEAGVSARTVYVRFGSKASLFRRVVDVAVVGDVEHVPVLDRDWVEPALTAPSLAARIDSWAGAARQIMGRIGRLMLVAHQAAATEPEIAELVALGQAQSLEAERVFWSRAAADGLLDPSIELDWIIVTASALDAVDTYVRLVEQHGWSLDDYEAWLARSLLALATSGIDHD